MKTEDLNIIREEEILDEISMDNIKGGLTGESRLCCVINSHCNKNAPEQSKDYFKQPNNNNELIK